MPAHVRALLASSGVGLLLAASYAASPLTMWVLVAAPVVGWLAARHLPPTLDAARVHTLRILGPNCIGLLVPHLGLNASFAHIGAQPGDLAFVSQSGALVTAMLDWAGSRGIGFSNFVSLGERADVDFGDMLDYLGSDPKTRAILLYIESVDESHKFMSAARAAARNTPVIVVKAGRSSAGQAAAASHTGALAGSDAVFDAAIARSGMLRVLTLPDLFLAAETLSRFRDGPSGALTVLTNGGGAGVLAADEASTLGVPLAQLDDAMLARLDAVLPANWSHGNPVDIIGDAPAERYVAALEALVPTYEDRGFTLKAINGGWRFYSHPECSDVVEKFVLDGQQNRLTQAALETLAVIAYRQPISRARVSAIRGVNVEAVMKTLVTRGLVEEYGLENETGAILYKTTSYFLERLGLNALTDLPPLAPHLPDIDGLDEILDSLTD